MLELTAQEATNHKQRNRAMFNVTSYRGYDIQNDNGEFTVIDDNGSGHVCDDMADCKATIDGWEA